MSNLQNATLVLNSYDGCIATVNNSNLLWNNINLRTVLGDMYDKYDLFNLQLNSIAQSIPVNSPLRVELQLVSNLNQAIGSIAALDGTSVTGTKLDEIEYIANFIKLSDGVMNQIYSSLEGQPLEFALTDFSNYQYSYSGVINAGSVTPVNFPIAAKFSSLKSLFCTIRDRGTGTDTYFPFSSVSAGITSYYCWRIGSNILPSKAPDSLRTRNVCRIIKSYGIHE